MDNILEPYLIKYISVPSLESITTVNIVTALCKQSDIRDTIQQHALEVDPVGGEICDTCDDQSFIQIEKNILDKLSPLLLSKLLKTKVANIVRPIELQILECIPSDCKNIEYMDSICWTSEGVIDKVKTLKQLIDKSKGKNIRGYFQLACMYCLEENILQLWNQLPSKKKSYLQRKSIYAKYDTHLIAYWIHTINNELPRLFSKIKKSSNCNNIYNFNDSVHKNMFSLALFERNILAVQYFWNKLTEVEIYSNLVEWVNDAVGRKKLYYRYIRYQRIDKNADVLYFLLSKMSDKTKQKEILQRNSDVILKSLFLDWPWQRFLLPTMQVMSEFMDHKVYIELFVTIAAEIKENKTTEKLLRELWYGSSINLKKCFIKYLIDDSHGTDILCNLLMVDDVETIKAIFDCANVEEKKQVIFSLVKKNENLLEVIFAGKLSSLNNMLIDFSSESDINNIKESIVCNYGNRICHRLIWDNNLNMLDKFLNWAFHSPDQVHYFKNNTLHKIEIIYSLISRQSNYELVNKFMEWCFDSKKEICQFKKYFAKAKLEIVYDGCKDENSLEKFVDWCFDTKQEINDYKSYILHSYEIGQIIFTGIAYGYDFEFINNLINWFCFSSIDIKKYKANFVLSTHFLKILQVFVSNHDLRDSDWTNWDLVKKSMSLFSPLEENIISQLKQKIAKLINFNNYESDFKHFSYKIKKEDLFCLLENDSYEISEDQCAVNYMESDDDQSSSDNNNSSDYTDNDDNHLHYSDDCFFILTEILKEVESGLLG